MTSPPSSEYPFRGRRRSLKAVLAGDVVNSSGNISVDETRAATRLLDLLKIARTEIEGHQGWLIGMPGDGLFALFDSAVEGVTCALAIQNRMAERTSPGGLLLRIGIHLGDVLFEDGLPFGEALTIAARLQSLADPGGVLVSSAVVDAVSGRISAMFEDRGVPKLRNIPRRIAVCSVKPLHRSEQLNATLDRTTPLRRSASAPAATTERHADTDHRATPLAGGDGQASPQPVPQPRARIAGLLDQSSTRRPSAEDVEKLSHLLAVHVGPLARIIAARQAARASSLAELITLLEAEIPNAAEKSAFRQGAARLGAPKT